MDKETKEQLEAMELLMTSAVATWEKTLSSSAQSAISGNDKRALVKFLITAIAAGIDFEK